MSIEKLPVFENFPDEDKKISKLIKWNKDKIFAPISKRTNFLLSLVNSGFVEIPADDVAPGADGNWRWRVDDDDLVLQRKVTGVWTDTSIKAVTTGDIVLSNVSGKGIKVDFAAPTFGFRDLLGEVTQKNTGASKPTDAVFQDGIRGYRFAVGEEERFEYHIPHDHVPNTDIFLHLHWAHNSAIVTGGNMVFGYEVSYAKGHNQAAYPASKFGTVTGNASTTQYQHMLDEVQLSAASPSASQIDTNDIEPDGIIKLRIDVQSNNITSSGAVPDPFIDYVDIHYQSTNMATKALKPNFYTGVPI